MIDSLTVNYNYTWAISWNDAAHKCFSEKSECQLHNVLGLGSDCPPRQSQAFWWQNRHNPAQRATALLASHKSWWCPSPWASRGNSIPAEVNQDSGIFQEVNPEFIFLRNHFQRTITQLRGSKQCSRFFTLDKTVGINVTLSSVVDSSPLIKL